MPASIGASYRSLGDLGEDVYKSTTIVDQTHQTTGQSVLESVKKAFTFAAPKVELRRKDPLIRDQRESISIVTRYTTHLTFIHAVMGTYINGLSSSDLKNAWQSSLYTILHNRSQSRSILDRVSRPDLDYRKLPLRLSIRPI